MTDETNTNTDDIENAIAEEEATAEAIHARLGELESELAASRDRHLRLAAEFDNYRKRTAREQTESVARAQAGLIARLVDVLDDLDRVAHHSENSSKEALLEGVELVERKFRNVLESAGLERIDPTGLPFDPSMMEALTTVPVENPEEDHQVASVFQPGYRYQGTLVRPARVVVKKYEG
ncbi:MAG: nucleotide exchange factor GrpE [Gemmatimonadota bacterium]